MARVIEDSSGIVMTFQLKGEFVFVTGRVIVIGIFRPVGVVFLGRFFCLERSCLGLCCWVRKEFWSTIAQGGVGENRPESFRVQFYGVRDFWCEIGTLAEHQDLTSPFFAFSFTDLGHKRGERTTKLKRSTTKETSHCVETCARDSNTYRKVPIDFQSVEDIPRATLA